MSTSIVHVEYADGDQWRVQDRVQGLMWGPFRAKADAIEMARMVGTYIYVHTKETTIEKTIDLTPTFHMPDTN